MKKRKRRNKRSDHAEPRAADGMQSGSEGAVALMEPPQDEASAVVEDEAIDTREETQAGVAAESAGGAGAGEEEVATRAPETVGGSLKPDDTLPGPEASRAAYRQVGKEVLSMELDPEAWAQALAECGGTHEDALRFYARIRTESLTKSHRDKHEKIKELECRRRVSFRDFRDVDVLEKIPASAAAIPRLIDSIYWHVLAGVSMAGSLLAARMLWPSAFSNTNDGALVLIILAMQLIPILAWCAGSGWRGAVTYSGVAQLTASIALFASVIFSVQLFENGDRLLAERDAWLVPEVHQPNHDPAGEGGGALTGQVEPTAVADAEDLLARSDEELVSKP